VVEPLNRRLPQGPRGHVWARVCSEPTLAMHQQHLV